MIGLEIHLPEVADLVALLRELKGGLAQGIWLDGARTGALAGLAVAAIALALWRR